MRIYLPTDFLLTNIVVLYSGVTVSVDKKKLWMSSSWASVKLLVQSPTTFLCLNWRDLIVTDGLQDGDESAWVATSKELQ